jgi:SAM-dependent methyltransferase
MSEFISTLPKDIISGNNVQLPENIIRRIFNLVNLNPDDVFYDLGCGEGNAVYIAAKEYNVKKAIGIELKKKLIDKANKKINGIKNALVIHQDIRNIYLSGGTVFLFWFYDTSIVKKMVKRFSQESQPGARIISVWSPPDLIIPDKTDFPFFVSTLPFKYAKNFEDQIYSMYGRKCIDYTFAWMLAERYIETMQEEPSQYKRFLNILISMIIWINAWNMKATCEDQIPPPVESYLGILRTFFNIELSDMLIRE